MLALRMWDVAFHLECGHAAQSDGDLPVQGLGADESEVDEVNNRVLALLMFVTGVAVTSTIQYRAGLRPTWDVRKWKPVWTYPAFNRNLLFWLGECLWTAGVVLMFVGH